MKSQDLMVGDWVRVIPYKKNGRIYRIDYTYGKGNEYVGVIDGDFDIGLLEPIPLTPEILEKNLGVVERSSDGYNLVINSELILAFHSKATLDFWISQLRDWPHLTYSLPLPRYVHELQHALRLCGIDKTIEL